MPLDSKNRFRLAGAHLIVYIVASFSIPLPLLLSAGQLALLALVIGWPVIMLGVAIKNARHWATIYGLVFLSLTFLHHPTMDGLALDEAWEYEMNDPEGDPRFWERNAKKDLTLPGKTYSERMSALRSLESYHRVLASRAEARDDPSIFSERYFLVWWCAVGGLFFLFQGLRFEGFNPDKS